MNFSIPLVKIDEEKRLVVGRAAQEVLDRSGEILDYATAKPAFKEWSDSFVQATGGLSKGNVRVMHNPKVVAGKVVEIEFNDQDKAIDVVCKIVDDNEWKKVVEGVYTGFSVGGSYGPKWDDPKGKRYTPKVAEISLVDRPCIPTATIAELHKADGSIEEVRLTGRVRTFGEISAPRTFGQIESPRTFGELAKAAETYTAPELIAGTTGVGLGGGLGFGIAAARKSRGSVAVGLGLLGAAAGGRIGSAAGRQVSEKTGARKYGENDDPGIGNVAGAFGGMYAGVGAGFAGGVYGAKAVARMRQSKPSTGVVIRGAPRRPVLSVPSGTTSAMKSGVRGAFKLASVLRRGR